MLKLKRVEIQGFKSFYERTEMKFSGSGIAAVVGPNGCGKSNLSDAISWVLGEQSAKSLRGARMEDVIFAGTRAKKPLSMASVTMTLIPDEAALHFVAVPSGIPVPVNGQNGHAPASEAVVASLEAANSAEASEASDGSAPPQETSTAAADPESGTVAASDGVAEAPVAKPAVAETAAERGAPAKRGEITITRRLYRSGESEYLINGKTARLRDIQDLFLGTGLGPESYAIIEQGRIGQILSNKPQDRRNVIEEAAGITKYKNRKRLAEAKLETAKQNLARVFDILEEVTRQANSLKRQAAKTKRYSELKEEKDGVLRLLLMTRFQSLEKESARLVIALNLASTNLLSAQEEIAAAEREREAAVQHSYENEEQLTVARRRVADLRLEFERAQAKFEYQNQQLQQIDARLKAGAGEEERLQREESERSAELGQGSEEVGRLADLVNESRDLLNTKVAERQTAQARLSEQERTLEGSRQALLRILGDISVRTNKVTQMEGNLATFDRDSGRAKNEEEQALSDRERINKLRSDLSARLAARQTDLLSVSDQRKEMEQQLAGTRSRLSEARPTVERLRSEASRIRARRDSLEEIIQHRSYSTETVKRLFTAVERGNAADLKPLGVLADFLEVDRQFEKAAEEFLHEELEYVVVQDWAHADRGLELMRGELNGRATFLVEQSAAGIADGPGGLAFPKLEEGRLSRLSDSLRFTNGLTNTPHAILPRIANCFVTPDRNYAQELAPKYPHCWFLSEDGASYAGQTVTGGKKTGAGPLALKRELREVSQLEKAKAEELSQAQKTLAELDEAIASLTEHLDALRSRMQSQEKEVLALDHEARKLGEDFNRIETRLSRARLELHRLEGDRKALQDKLETELAALASLEQGRTEQEEALESARDGLRELQGDVAHLTEEHATLRAQSASLDERLRSLTGQEERLRRQVTELRNRQANLKRERETLTADRERFTQSNAELEGHTAGLRETVAAAEASAATLSARETEFRAAQAAIDERLKQLRTTAQAIGDERNSLQISLARQESDIKHLEETCHSELGTSLQEVSEAVTAAGPITRPLEELQSSYDELRRKIDALGPVNPQALQEFEEAQTRQEFLLAQRQDLLDSIRDTEKAIGELDGESRKRFMHAFTAINGNFRTLFGTLFGGGTGEMRLSDEENAAESGIDLVASPPGKRLQSVLLLSGGEKSLTAMALLMAIFQYTPSPFCVLDEVDAPLDEPNIERLTRLIGNMSEQTQFIVITHSKRTMEAAQSLYGVTMQEPGVSKLVSVKFKAADGARPAPEQNGAHAERQMQAALA